MNIVHRPIPRKPGELVILCGELRFYAALASDGNSFHVVQPARIDDARVGDGKVLAGDLVCSCPAGQFARLCWAQKLALAYEHATPIEIAWLAEPATSQQEVTSR